MSSSSSSLPATLALVGTSALVAASLTWLATKRTSVPADLATTQSVITTSKAKAIVYPLEKLTDPNLSSKDKFLALYPMLTKELLEDLKESNELNEESLAWCRAMMDYTVPGGKLNRGMTVVTVVQSILGTDKVSPTLLAQSAVCGWAIEFLQSFFLVADDVMDDSPTRRGQPCWYKKEAVKLIAINDSFLLESFVFGILKRHFCDAPCYAALVELLRDVVFKTEVGQLLDLTSQPQDKPVDLERFTLARYKAIVKYKTAFYTFYLPTAMGMLLAGVTQPEAYKVSRTLCCAMGEYFQIQDDYLDCFGEPAVIGKVGTDIQDNKCSWLVVQALDRCNPTQRQELLNNYGQWDDKKVAKVKELYRDLDLPAVFAMYEEESYATIQKELDALIVLPRAVFEILLQKIYKRSK
jgi:farnesyl diphosphate synthase